MTTTKQSGPGTDPFEVWREMYDANERTWSAALEQAMGSPEFGDSSGKLLETMLAAQKTVRDNMRTYLETMNVPTREDIARLGELVIGLEEKIDQVADRLDEIEDAVRAVPGGPAGPIGPAGPTGAKGPAGSVGHAGKTGRAGRPGPKGAAGPRGQAGPAGPKGPAGPRGQAGTTGRARSITSAAPAKQVVASKRAAPSKRGAPSKRAAPSTRAKPATNEPSTKDIKPVAGAR